MKRIILIIGVLALVVSACGADDVGEAGPVTLAPSDTSVATTTTSTTASGTEPPVTTNLAEEEPEPADQLFVEVFFVKEGLSARSVIRAVDLPDVATNAIQALIEGPTPAEQDTELSSAIPADTLLLGLTIEDGLATVDLSREFEVGGGSFNILSRLAQVVYTLTQFDTVDEVLFHLDGEPVEVFSGEGVVLGEPVDRSDYATILPIEPGPDVTASEPWSQDDLPDIGEADPAMLSRVVLVTADDVLNVRQDPTVRAPIVGMLPPGTIVERTGQEEITDSSRWVQIETPVGGFWVNDWYLADYVDAPDFDADPEVTALLDEFAGLIAADGDLRPVTSRRGLYVSHHGDPVRFEPNELSSILTSTTTYQWPSNAIAEDDPEFDLLPARSFAEAVADSFLSAYDDPDTVTTLNEPIAGGNGRIPEYAIPFELASFNYVGVYDEGDVAEYEGLDWVTWYASIDYEDGSPVIVALTIDQWSP